MNSLNLKQLDDEELKKYIDNECSLGEREDFNIRNSTKDKMKSIRTYTKSINESVDLLEEYINEDKLNDYFIGLEINRISSLLKRSIGKVYDISLNFGCVKKEVRKGVVGEKLKKKMNASLILRKKLRQ